jgi:quercetin dioxygenase-like cupin family protein
MSHFLDLDAREAKQVAPGVHTKTFWKDEMLMSIVVLDPGSEVAMHSHSEEQCGLVVKGELIMEIAGERRKVQAGTYYMIPKDVPHYAKATSKGATVLDVFSPPRKVLQY